MPKVGVVIPCYNLGRYLDETVDSVLRQTFQDFEIIIINPGSTDEFTNKLLSNYKRPKAKVISTPHMGVSESRNIGIREARSPYICCLDSDDLLEPTCLEKTTKILDEHPTIGFVSFWYKMFDGGEGVVMHESCGIVDFLIDNSACAAAVFRKKAWEKCGGYDESLKTGFEDWDFWVNILTKGYEAYIVKEFLFKYRIRPGARHYACDNSTRRRVLFRVLMKKYEKLFRDNALDIIAGKDYLFAQSREYWQYMRDDLMRLRKERQEKERIIEEREHALRALQLSKAWRLGSAFRDARGSVRGFFLLPFRIIDLGCPDAVKRLVKRCFMVRDGETLRKNFFKMPYRMAASIFPAKLKDYLPCFAINLGRDIFRIEGVRFTKQKKWNGPLVSVVIPCHNYGRYIDDALESVIGQTFRNFEIIIVDDGSDDKATINMLAEIERKGKGKLEIIRQKNQGVSSARNNGIRMARGKYICCLDADDKLAPTYIEKCVATLESENLDICYSYAQLFGDEDWIWKTADFDIKVLKKINCVPTAAVFKRSIWKKVGGFNPEIEIGAEERAAGRFVGGAPGRGYEDWNFWISIAEHGGRGKLIPEPLFYYRRHGGARGIGDNAEIHEKLVKKIMITHPALYERKVRGACERYYVVENPFVNLTR